MKKVDRGPVEYFRSAPLKCSRKDGSLQWEGMFKKSPPRKGRALPGLGSALRRSRLDAWSVHPVPEYGKRARTPVAAFFNIPRIIFHLLKMQSARTAEIGRLVLAMTSQIFRGRIGNCRNQGFALVAALLLVVVGPTTIKKKIRLASREIKV